MADEKFNTYCVYIFMAYMLFLFLFEFLLKGKKKEPTPAEVLMTEKTRYYRVMSAELPKISASLQLLAIPKEIPAVKKEPIQRPTPTPQTVPPPARKSGLDLGLALMIETPPMKPAIKPPQTSAKKKKK